MTFSKWSFNQWPDERTIHSGFSSFETLLEVPAGINEVRSLKEKFHFLYRPRGFKTLVVVFHGSVSPSKLDTYSLPVFSGSNLASNVEADFLMMSDATLSLAKSRILLGWFSGDPKIDMPKIVERIVSKVFDAGRYEHIVFCGGSGGGFASMRASCAFPGSTAVVWNPQTDLSRYHPGLIKKYVRECFDVPEFHKLPNEIRQGRMMNIIKIVSECQKSKFIYLQNKSDDFHMRNHAHPMISAIDPSYDFSEETEVKKISDRFVFAVGDWGDGHVAPDVSNIGKILSLVIDGKYDGDEIACDVKKIMPEYFS